MTRLIQHIWCKRLVTAAFAAVMTLIAGATPVKLVTSADQYSSNATQSGTELYHLLNFLGNNFWASDPQFNSAHHYLQIDLGETIQLAADEQIVVETKRYDHSAPIKNLGIERRTCNPTAFKFEISLDGINWEPFRDPDTHVYFLYRGPNTLERSTRMRTDKPFRYMRFTVTQNNSRTFSDPASPDVADVDHKRRMVMSGFNVIRLKNTDFIDTTGEDGWIDALRWNKDYKNWYEDYTFENTRGFVDPRNQHVGASQGWVDWANRFDANGNWIFGDDQVASDNAKVSIPSYDFWTSEDHDHGEIYGLEPGQKRQPTHVVEHVLYAMPGDVVVLYPYYDLPGGKNWGSYQMNFVHWYDYSNGKGVTRDDPSWINSELKPFDILDHHIKPQRVLKLKNGDWIAGPSIPDAEGNFPDNEPYGYAATFFCPRNPYVEGGQHMGLPRQEYVIAADFSQEFSSSYNIDKENHVIVEPAISVRHIFRIRSGKENADELSGSVQNNLDYVRRNRRYITAPSDRDFQVRLDAPVPIHNPETSDLITPPSKWYYKISETDYRRFGSCSIKLFNTDTGEEISNDGRFSLGEDFKGYGTRNNAGINYFMGGGSGSYNRMLKISADNIKDLVNLNPTGRFTVQLIALDQYAGEPIHPYGAPDADLIVQEFRIEFAPRENALICTESELTQYPHATVQSLSNEYGTPVATVNFDQYADMPMLSDADNDYFKKINGHNKFKWPVPWESSQYSFGYGSPHDYNMYLIGDHCAVTPYYAAAGKFPNELNFGQGAGLYDRLFYDTQGQRKGFFYYVNASTDPGVMATLDVDELCLGATLHVSAWVSEFSETTEVCNIAFNFIAVKHNGDKVPLNTFVTGYVPVKGRWMKVYYSFVPNFAETQLTTADIDRYELQLDNNCKNSNGADYAVDDIRVYVTKPSLFAEQTAPLCSDEREAPVRLETPFASILQTIGRKPAVSAEQSEEVTIYYTFLDKEVYQLAIAEGKSGFDAHNEAVLRYNYMPEKDDDGQTWGKISFHTFLPLNKTLNESNKNELNVAMVDKVNGVDCIVFNTRPAHDGLRPGKEYIAALYANLITGGVIVDDPTAEQFDIENKCAKRRDFTVRGSAVVKINGVLVADANNIEVCENQLPVVQVNVQGRNTEGKLETIVENAYFDWYSGTLKEFESLVSEKGVKLSDAIVQFRGNYPESTTADVEPMGGFTADMRDYLVSLTTPDGDMAEPKLRLHYSSFIFPPVSLPEGVSETEMRVVAIPMEYHREGWKICNEPTEIKIKVRQHSPLMRHGFKAIEYPSTMNDVPLRIGLGQLQEISAYPAQLDSHKALLTLPVRHVSSTSDNVNGMVLGEDSYLYMARTNDPQYQSLTPDGSTTTPGLPISGKVRSLSASIGGAANSIDMVLSKLYNFKEGYEYTFKFGYREHLNDESLRDTLVCDGEEYFTVIVVPEYQMWTGAAENLDWNNDLNWRRVSSAELLGSADEKKDYVTDGSNANSTGYIPMDFTKVIIPEGLTFPDLYAKDPGKVSIEQGAATKTYDWYPEIGEGATRLVNYHMAAESQTEHIYCRPWYMNTAEQVHFNSNAEIMNQQHLIYQKAWADLTLTPGRWYTLGSPLMDVYAGDMYLPTKDAWQSTELFTPIVYDASLNGRFRPAVFQRSWNKATATVYEIGGGSRNVAVATDWSRVYNDVNRNYSSGEAFSVKADVTKMQTPADEVRFRLPKDDTAYDYYSEDGSVVGNHTDISRSNSGRLNQANGRITVSGAKAGRYFMVGNPFMAHLDMAKLLRHNSGVVNPKYWIMTADSQQAAIMDENSGGFVGTADNLGLVAPFQGFFVEAISDAVSIELEYTEDMMTVAPQGVRVKAPASRGALDDAGYVTVSATDAEGNQSLAMISADSSAESGYAAREDVALIIDPLSKPMPLVYSVAGDVCSVINCRPDLEGTEVGVYADDDSEVTLRFAGAALDGYSLYDKSSDEYLPIDDNTEVTVRGSVSGRFFITAGIVEQPAGRITVTVEQSGVTVTTATDYVSCRVHDLTGRMVETAEAGDSTLTVHLDSGVYIVEAGNGIETVTRKIVIR